MTWEGPWKRSRLDPDGADFRENLKHYERLEAELAERLAAVARGGPKEAVERHRERGKLLPRERIDRIVDPGSPFLELSPLAAYGLYEGEVPSAGIVTGDRPHPGQAVRASSRTTRR